VPASCGPSARAFITLSRCSGAGCGRRSTSPGYDLEPGSWLWVRPGQVHQWGDLTGADGKLIIFEQGFLDQATSAHLGDPYGTVVRVPAEPDQAALRAATSALEGEFRTPGRLPLEIHLAILRHLLSVVVLNLAQLGASPGRPAPRPPRRFAVPRRGRDPLRQYPPG
jgi:hypothetical protein